MGVYDLGGHRAVANGGIDETYFPGRAASIWRRYKDGKTELIGTFGM